MFNISNFRSEIDSRGVLRTNRFLVTFNTPIYLKDRYVTRQFSLRCEAAQLPGMQFATIDGPPRLGYGPIESTPYGVVFEDMSLTFIVDSNSVVHKFFYDWVNCIVNYNNKGSPTAAGMNGPVSNMRTYEVGYRKDFSTDVSVTMYNGTKKDGAAHEEKVLTAKIYNAFPKGLPSVDLAWEQQDGIVKLTIPFNYTDYNIEYFKI